MERSSLLDLFSKHSWIKKSNFEGIFNGFFFVFIMVLAHLPIVNFSKYGRFVDPTFFNILLNNSYNLALNWTFILSYSFLAFFNMKFIIWIAEGSKLIEYILTWL
jgi:hypothetical protein